MPEIQIDAKKLTYGVFKRLLKAQAGEMQMLEMVNLLEGLVVGDVNALDDLPVADVFKALTDAMTAAIAPKVS